MTHPSVWRRKTSSGRWDTKSICSFLASEKLNATSCVIADVQMPGMNGVELQSHLRAKGSSVPFIFISAFPEEAIRGRALREGAICFLAKPFDGCVLINHLNTALFARGGEKNKE
jgi:FixJ family two-component response regulator